MNLIHKGLPHDLVTLKSYSPTTVTLGTRFSTYGFVQPHCTIAGGEGGLQLNTGMATSDSEHCGKGGFQSCKYLTAKVTYIPRTIWICADLKTSHA